MNSLEVQIERKGFAGAGNGAARVAIQSLGFAVPEGQFACIVGPSGCGKTTLLNIISALDKAFEGQVRIAGANGEAPRIGYVFQTPRLMPWLTVRDNVRLGMPRPGRGPGLAEALLSEMQLDDVLDANPGQLSGGMQRRVALARAFVNEPRLLLLDEPFLSLDAPTAGRLRGQLLELWQRHPTTILFVTHDLREALCLADRVLFLSPGPARVVLDYKVELPRPRNPESAAIDDLRRRLLDKYPDLLAGIAKS